VSDWNGDGLDDNWDEAHEFGIDLDGDPIGDDGPGDDNGLDVGILRLFDASDLLGADLVDLSDFRDREWADGLSDGAAGFTPAPLPFGEAFVELLGALGDEPLPLVELLGFVAGLSVVNPFVDDAPDQA
jgi:hypothetical protein